jgi:hypothetical protein
VVYGIVLPALYKYHIIIIMIIMIIMIIIHYDHDYPIIDYKHNRYDQHKFFWFLILKKKSDGITHIIWFLEIILVDIRFIIWFHGYYLVIIWFLILPILDII